MRVRTGTWRTAALVLGAMALLAACQGDYEESTISLEEARQVTAEFQTTEYQKPPRTITDVLDMLGAPHETTDNCKQEQDDRRESLNNSLRLVGTGANNKQIDRSAAMLVFLSAGEFAQGNLTETADYIKKAIRSLPPKYHGVREAAFRSQLALINAVTGEPGSAVSNKTRVHSLFAQVSQGVWGGTSNGKTMTKMYNAVASAAAAYANGDLQAAEFYIKTALAARARLYVSSVSFHIDKPLLYFMLMDTLAKQGRLSEAELVARQYVKSNLRKSIFPKPTATAPVVKFAQVLYDQGRIDEGIQIAQWVVTSHITGCSLPSSFGFVRARQVLAQGLAASGNWQGVLEQVSLANESLSGQADVSERYFAAFLEWPLALVHTGKAEEGLARLEKMLAEAEEQEGAESYAAAEVRGLLAMARAATDDNAGALGEFSVSVQALLNGGEEHGATNATWRNFRTSQILDSYMELLFAVRGSPLERESGIDAAAEMLVIAAARQSGGVQRAFNAAASRAAARDPELADLVRREQDAAQEIDVVLDTLLRLEMTGSDYKRRNSLRERLSELRNARRAVAKEIETKFPTYSDVMSGKPISTQEIRKALRAGESLIAYHVGAERSFVWAIPGEGDIAFSAIEMGRDELAENIGSLRTALEPNARTLDEIPEFDTGAAHDLYNAILAPVEAGWKKSNSLLIVAHGPLGYLPFSLLPTARAVLPGEKEPLFARYRGVPWLVRTHAVTVLPSVQSLRTLRGLPPGNENRLQFAGFGDSWFSSDQATRGTTESTSDAVEVASRGIVQTRGVRLALRAAPKTRTLDRADLSLLPRLPDTGNEIRSIALALDADLTRDVFTGKEASEDRVKRMDLSGYKVLAFATHGLVPGDLDGLTQPALAFSAPEVTGGDEDGLLTMGEVLGLKLDADWVVLSACNTGAGDGEGAEAISGLGRAFFYAGARALLVSNWPVETTSAKALTTDLFKRQADDPTLSRAEALQRTMLGLIDGPGFVDANGKTVFSYAHPIFWAPFTLIGDGG